MSEKRKRRKKPEEERGNIEARGDRKGTPQSSRLGNREVRKGEREGERKQRNKR